MHTILFLNFQDRQCTTQIFIRNEQLYLKIPFAYLFIEEATLKIVCVGLFAFATNYVKRESLLNACYQSPVSTCAVRCLPIYRINIKRVLSYIKKAANQKCLFLIKIPGRRNYFPTLNINTRFLAKYTLSVKYMNSTCYHCFLELLKEKYLFVVFFGSFCGSSASMMPYSDRLSDFYHSIFKLATTPKQTCFEIKRYQEAVPRKAFNYEKPSRVLFKKKNYLTDKTTSTFKIQWHYLRR